MIEVAISVVVLAGIAVAISVTIKAAYEQGADDRESELAEQWVTKPNEVSLRLCNRAIWNRKNENLDSEDFPEVTRE